MRRIITGLALVMGLNGPAYAVSLPQLDVPYVPTPPEVVEAMLDVAEVSENDLVYDLGAGDGRIVIAAAARGARGVGVDLDPARIKEAKENARAAGVDDRVEFVEADLFEIDFSTATVLTLYLFPGVNLELRPRILEELAPGSRVVSHAFDMGEWRPDQVLEVDHRTVYFWIVPADVAGSWQWRSEAGEAHRLQLEQEFQHVRGNIEIEGEQASIYDVVLQGVRLAFVYDHPRLGTQQVNARLEDERLVGTIEAGGSGDPPVKWEAERTADGGG